MSTTDTNTRGIDKWAAKILIVLFCGAVFSMLMGFALARADECFRDDAQVRAAYGEKVWAAYTRHMDGHKGELCYYPSVKGNPKVHLHIAQRRAPAAPRAMATRADVEPAKMDTSPIEPRPLRSASTRNLEAATAPLFAMIYDGNTAKTHHTTMFDVVIVSELRSICRSDGWREAAFVLGDNAASWPLVAAELDVCI